jgi:alpha-tubulin suppressor-like RCC1 family protein
LGLGTTQDTYTPTEINGNYNVMDVSVGFYHSFIVTTAGTAYGFGRNNYGQLGDNSLVDKYIPTLPINENSLIKKTSLGGYTTNMLKQNGFIYSFGYNVLFFSIKICRLMED